MKLNEIKFFKTKDDVINYLEEEKLELIENQDSSNQDKVNEIVKLFNDFFSGKSINLNKKFDELNIDLGLEEKFTTPFSQKIIQNVMMLNRGETTTYSEIGKKIGSKAYRAIGNVLKKNPLPLIIPCHRVLRKNGDIGGFMGKMNEGWEQSLKKNLLEIEGHINQKNGK